MRLALKPIDAWLLLMTLIWGSNFSLIKGALAEIPELGFNALRLLTASAIFLAAILLRPSERPQAAPSAADSRRRRARMREAPMSGGAGTFPARDRAALVGLAIVGHFVYQFMFLGGLARTSVANSSLIFACTPVAVALLTAALGHERVGPTKWAGAALSLFGVYLAVGHGATLSDLSLRGDLMIVAALLCWVAYTVGSRPLLARHSPLVVTGWSMAIGSAMYAPFGIPSLMRLDWQAVSLGSWGALAFSAVFGLFVAYLIWYTAVQRIGNARTSVYSNMVPVAAMTVAAIWLKEPIGPLKIAGACFVLTGVAITKIEVQTRSAAPSEA